MRTDIRTRRTPTGPALPLHLWVTALVVRLILAVSGAAEIRVANGRLSLEFSAQTGALVDATFVQAGDTPGTPPQGRCRLLGGGEAPVDVQVDGKWCLSQPSWSGRQDVLCLDGDWDFRTEAGEWRRLRVPGFWEAQGVTQLTPGAPEPDWTPYNGTAYYRTTFQAPAAWRGQAITLEIAGVDDEDWTSLNGTAVGHTGMDVENWWTAIRVYRIPPETLRFDGANTLEVKVFDRGGDGGIAGSVLVGPTEVFASRQPSALRLTSHQVEDLPDRQVLTLDSEAPNWQVRTVYELPTGRACFSRRAEWTYTGTETAELTAARFSLPGICPGATRDCLFTMPTFWPPREIAFTELKQGRTWSAHASGAVPAAAVVYNAGLRVGLVATAWVEADWAETVIREGATDVRVDTVVHSRGALRQGSVLRLGTEVVSVVPGTLLDAIAGTGPAWELAGFRLAPKPEWAYGASLFSLWVGGSLGSGCSDLGGLRNFQTYLLPRLERIGFDAVWLNPINRGGYGTTVHREIEPRHGTLDDLKTVCDEAHQRGLRVWLDLIPHGPQEKSPDGQEIIAKHPDWVSRDKDGAMKPWWGCLSCDYAHPGWQAEMADVATFYVRRCGIDGWRVDCAAGGPPNERPYGDLRPSQSGLYGSLGLLENVRQAMAAARPDSVILGETGSAMHLSRCHFIYDWSTEQAVFRALPATAPAAWVPQAKAWLERQEAALPEGAANGLMRFLENHDQFRSVYRYGPGHERALLSLCALVPGLVFVFHEQDLGFGPHLARLFQARKACVELQRGRSVYTGTACSDPEVFAFERRLGDSFALVAINFSGGERQVAVTRASDAAAMAPAATRYHAVEFMEETDLGVKPLADWAQVDLTLPGYGTRLLVFRREGQTLPRPVARPSLTAPPAQTRTGPITVERQGEELILTNGAWRLVLANGLIRSLSDASGRTLVSAMNVVEGKRKIWPGARLDFAAAVKASGEVRTEGNRTVVAFAGSLDRGFGVRVPWNAQYALDEAGEIAISFALQPIAEARVRGQLGLDLEFGQARAWSVDTIEGRLEDEVGQTHPLGDGIRAQYWHRSGYLWENAIFPLASQPPQLSIRTESAELALALPPRGAGLENAYLRERNSGGQPNLTLHLAWLDEKGQADLSAPLQVRLGLRVGAESAPSVDSTSGQDWTLRTVGSRYEFRSPAMELTVARGLGGNVLAFGRPGGEAVVTGSRVYSDYGLFAQNRDSLGQEVKAVGSSESDFEPDLTLGQTPRGPELTFRSFLRLAYWDWAHLTSPAVQYELRYGLGSGASVAVQCRARPMLSAPELKAFLAQTLNLRQVKAWRVQTVNGERSGGFEAGRGTGRVWQSANDPLAAGAALTIELANGEQVRFSGVAAPAEEVQNVFLLDAGANQAVVFFAFLDGRATPVTGDWRTVAYNLELSKP